VNTGQASDNPDELLRFELQQAIETVRHQTTLLVQVTGFLVALDSVLFAYGLSQAKAMLLFSAALVPLVALFAVGLIVSHVAPVAFVALQIELELLGHKMGLVASYLRTRMPQLYIQMEPLALAKVPMPVDRSLDRKLGYRFWSGRSGRALFLVFIFQMVVFVLSFAVFGFKFV